MLQDIYNSDTKANANKAFKKFIKTFSDKYPKAADCLAKDKDELLAFYDFPAANWPHLRTTNPIESTFATVRHRTYKAKGAFSSTTILTMVFKLVLGAQKRWKLLYGYKELADVIRGVKFNDGIKDEEIEIQSNSSNSEIAA